MKGKILWPEVPFTKCPVPENMVWRNITLRNITVIKPKESPGVVYGNESNPMLDITFDNVIVTDPGKHPWGDLYYWCQGVNHSFATQNTYPVPPCFTNQTTKNNFP